MKKFLLAAVLVACSGAHAGTYELLLEGKSCTESEDQQLECNYKIGKDFWLSIPGVGLADAGATFMKSDFNGMYYGTFGTQHGCVIVKTGRANKASALPDFAFISPKNGKVYRDWQSCKAGF